MARVVFTSMVRQYVDGEAEAEVEARTVFQLFKKLSERYAKLAPVLEKGFAVAIDGEVFEDALLQPIKPDSEVVLIPKIEGGAGRGPMRRRKVG